MTEELELRLDSAEAFFGALNHDDVMMRMAVLQAVRESPQLALAFGTYGGVDVVDELIGQFNQRHGFTYRLMLLHVLGQFDDLRVVNLFKKILTVWDDPAVHEIVVARLSREPIESLVSLLTVQLEKGSSRQASVSASHLLVEYPDLLSPRHRIRVSVANRAGLDVADADVSSIWPAWADELEDHFAHETRELLEARGEEAFVCAALYWKALPLCHQVWLLRWGAMAHPMATLSLVRHVLSSPEGEALLDRPVKDPRIAPASHHDVILTALQAVAGIEGASALLRKEVERFAESPDEEIRLAALRAGARAKESDDPKELCIWIEQAVAEQGYESVDRLVELLAHDSWQVRGATSAALVRLGDAVIPAVRASIAGSNRDGRMGAAAVLFQLGDVEWLEDNLNS